MYQNAHGEVYSKKEAAEIKKVLDAEAKARAKDAEMQHQLTMRGQSRVVLMAQELPEDPVQDGSEDGASEGEQSEEEEESQESTARKKPGRPRRQR